MKNISTLQRATLLKTISEKNLSEKCTLEISKAVKDARESKGHDEAEMVAQKILEILEQTDNEETIMKMLNTL